MQFLYHSYLNLWTFFPFSNNQTTCSDRTHICLFVCLLPLDIAEYLIQIRRLININPFPLVLSCNHVSCSSWNNHQFSVFQIIIILPVPIQKLTSSKLSCPSQHGWDGSILPSKYDFMTLHVPYFLNAVIANTVCVSCAHVVIENNAMFY